MTLGGHAFAFTPRADRATIDIDMKGVPRSTFPASLDAFRQGPGGIQRLENRVAKLPELLTELRQTRDASKAELEAIAAQIDKPFPHADQLRQTRRESETLQDRMDQRAAQAPGGNAEAEPQTDARPHTDARTGSQDPQEGRYTDARRTAAWRPEQRRHGYTSLGRD